MKNTNPKNIVVVGDVIIDEYTHGTKRGISAETPTIVANFVEKKMFVGGAGLVTRNLLRLGNVVTLITMGTNVDLGYLFRNSSDPISKEESCRLKALQLSADEKWTISTKHRYFVEQYKLLQYDSINSAAHNKRSEESVIKQFEMVSNDAGAVIICDNRHGVMSEKIAREIIKLCKRRDIPVFVDSQISQEKSNHTWYRGADFIFVNEKEAEDVVKSLGCADEFWDQNIKTISEKLDVSVICKRGSNGSVSFKKYDSKHDIHFGYRAYPADTCGAGDAFLAAFVSDYRDTEIERAMDFANEWAALSVTYTGTVVPKIESLGKLVKV